MSYSNNGWVLLIPRLDGDCCETKLMVSSPYSRMLLNITRALSEEKFVETGLSHRKPRQPLIVLPGERSLRN